MKVSDIKTEIMVKTRQFGVNGIEKNDVTKLYDKSIPVYASIAQGEIIDKTKYLKPYSFTVAGSTVDGFTAYPLPSDYLEIHKIYDKYGKNRIYDTDFFYVSDALYISNAYSGNVKTEYKPYKQITSLDDEFIVPNNYVRAIVSYIACNLIIGDDDTLASLYMSEWNEAIAMFNRQKGKGIKI
jgi:hypothetical protein